MLVCIVLRVQQRAQQTVIPVKTGIHIMPAMAAMDYTSSWECQFRVDWVFRHVQLSAAVKQ